jgi:phage-related protein
VWGRGKGHARWQAINRINKYVIIWPMKYTITFYNDAVEEAILDLPASLLARFFALTDRMENHGANLGEPHTKAFGNGLFELRLKGMEGIARVFYCTLVNRRIVMLHGFRRPRKRRRMNGNWQKYD